MYEKARVKFELEFFMEKKKIKALSLFDLKGLGQNVF